MCARYLFYAVMLFFGVYVVFVLVQRKARTASYKEEDPDPLEKKSPHPRRDALKNALLAFALSRVFKHKFEQGPVSTDDSGELLPPMSGSDMNMACFSYIIDPVTYRKSVFYTPIMCRKYERVDKFLEKHLGSTAQVKAFFDDFRAEVSQRADTDRPLEEEEKNQKK